MKSNVAAQTALCPELMKMLHPRAHLSHKKIVPQSIVQDPRSLIGHCRDVLFKDTDVCVHIFRKRRSFTLVSLFFANENKEKFAINKTFSCLSSVSIVISGFEK